MVQRYGFILRLGIAINTAVTCPSKRYAALVHDAQVTLDPEQALGLAALDALYTALTTPRRGRGRPWWPWGPPTSATAASVYLYGPVGRGKSLIMDVFVDALAGQGAVSVERVHFHAFMLSIHQRIHALQQAGQRGDPMPILAQEITARARVLCFDEFGVNNIADAMILGRLFAALWDQGLTLVVTSNFAPDDLYQDGLQRKRFLPFITLMKQRMQLVSIAGSQDYRTLKADPAQVFFAPLSPETALAFQEAYRGLSLSTPGGPKIVKVGNRSLALPWVGAGVAMARFADLCEKPIGVADYLALTRSFYALALDEVPRLGQDRRNEAARFRVLIDSLYEAGTLLILRSSLPAADLYEEAHRPENARVLSRLSEMQGHAYVNRALARLHPT